MKSPQEGDCGRKEKNTGDEPIPVIKHIYMEVSQGNSLCSYLKQKCLFSKTENRSCSGGWYQCEVEYYVSCTKMEKWDLLKLFQEWEEGDKGK
jgi:hypothetical protein